MNKQQEEAVKELLNDGNTPNFIAFYRKEETNDASIEEIRDLLYVIESDLDDRDVVNDEEIFALFADLEKQLTNKGYK